MKENNRKRSKRWNRRSSDGAAWDFGTDHLAENDEDRQLQQWHQKRWSSCSMALKRIAASEPLFSREPIRITKEFKDRIAAAARASLVTLVIFSILVFSGQDYLPVPWIGNVLAISKLKPTLGETAFSTKNVFVPMIPIAAISWGISTLLGSLSTQLYSILLPFVVMIGCLLIILCPWPYLTMKNLMLVIFYLIVASPLSLRPTGLQEDSLQEELGAGFVPGLVGTCSIGLFVALLMHITLIPVTKSSTASRLAPILVTQLAYENRQLLRSVSEYTQNIGKDTTISRQARTLIEFYVKRRCRTLDKLEKYLSAMRVERNFLCIKNNVDTVEAYVACSKKQQKHVELLQLATTQQFLGEEFTSLNETVRGVKTRFSTNIGFSIEQLSLGYSRGENALLFGSTSSEREDIFRGLSLCMDSYRNAMKQAISDAEALLLDDDDGSRSTAGPLIRQRIAFYAVFSFVHEIHDMVATLGSKRPTNKLDQYILSRLASRLMFTLKMTWLWDALGKRRLAMKTVIGLGLSSLWVSIPYLRGVLAYPNSVWVGVTVASVSLETTGAAYTKCLDRLWATLCAAAYALIVGKLFDPTNSIAKLFALSIFTFGATFLTNHERPYASKYAATSVGSILYGSFENNMAVNEYVPIRIMLIFIGVVTFLFVEMLVFPRSSRVIVQAQSLQFFENLEHFLFDCSKFCGSVSSIGIKSSKTEESSDHLAEDDPLWMLREGYEKITFTDDLDKTADIVKKTVALAKSELRPGIAEPSMGLNVSLDAAGYENLLIEQGKMLSQLDLLITTQRSLVGYYAHLPDKHLVRTIHWPALLSTSLVQIAQKLSECADNLRSVFSNGLCRPGTCDISHIIRAVAAFRNFEDVILAILSDVADRHAAYLNTISSSGDEVRYTPGFRLTIALAISAILTIGQSLTNSGKHLERIVQSFPIEEVDVEVPANTTTTINMGDG